MNRLPLPSQKFLSECFIYEADRGGLIWRERPETHFAAKRAAKVFNAKFAGKPAGVICKGSGYIVIRFEALGLFRAHRLIWKLIYNEEPHEIDHINLNRSDNRIDNLRKATNDENRLNKKVRSDSRTGIKGITKHGPSYRARVCLHGKLKLLGVYPTQAEAHDAYCRAAKELHGEFWNPG